MVIKKWEKDKAVKLRMEGKTYMEILREVKVARSTLSLWLRDVGLSKTQKQRITKKRLNAAKKGGAKKKQIRVDKTKAIEEAAAHDIQHISKRELWLMGIMLYWAEGLKEKRSRPSIPLGFGNSDARMLRIYLLWLGEIFSIRKKDLRISLYIHETSKHRMSDVFEYWRREIGFKESDFSYIYFKKHNPKTNRIFYTDRYFGLVDVRVKQSTDLRRRVEGWVKSIDEYYLNNCE